AEGRYGTEEELRLLKDYFPTVSLRLSAYQKIRDAEDRIVQRLEARMREKQPNIFQLGSKDVSSICSRDTKILLRMAIAAMLIDDLDRLRENILLWQRTIVKAFKEKHIAALVHTTMPEIIEKFLTPEEYALIQPILMLNMAVLAD
ncbi:MAG: allophycocyanin, partial [Cyanobacteria bacterium P01_C01_bin.72]